MTAIARHLTIHGRVQGVFYRDWAVRTARELALVGWVRNCSDGSVEAVVQGEEEAVLRFVLLAREGTPAASVSEVDAKEIRPGQFCDFKKRITF